VSLILDALRKSETQRQQLGNVALADLPHGKRHSAPWWLYVVGLLLAANLLLLAVVLLRPNSSSTPATTLPSNNKTATSPPAIQSTPSTAQPTTTFNQQPNQPLIHTTPLADAATPTPQVEYESVDRSVMDAASNPPQGPTLVRSANGNADQNTINLLSSSAPASLPPLRLDMHVYSPAAASRFVFINGHKYTEGQTLAEGPRVEAIVTDGVILNMQGTRWRVDRP
jgi:general secretion pathway protein B